MKNYLTHLHHWGKYNLDVVAVRHLYILQELAVYSHDAHVFEQI
jgi:hypothetical protein